MPGPTGQRGDIIGNKLLANNPNELTENSTPKDPVKLNGNTYNRFVIPLLNPSEPMSATAAQNQEHINRILKALKGSGIIHFK
jgi:hypothetical protein